MKLRLEIIAGKTYLLTENNEIVENIEVHNIQTNVEDTKDGPVRRLTAEVKIFEQNEVLVKESHPT